MNILITGASKGVGFELTKEMLSRDQQVIAVARSEDLLNELKNQSSALKGRLLVIPGDLTDSGFRNRLAGEVKKTGGLDVLINNAGLLIKNKPEDFTVDEFDRLFDVNVKSPFFLVQSLLSVFNKNAHIVNISSMGGFQGSAKFAGLSLYSAAKGALAVLTESLAEELKDQNIRVNCLALGAVQTEMLAKAFPGYKAPVQPAEMAGFIAGFALKGSGFLNGKIIPVSLSTP